MCVCKFACVCVLMRKKNLEREREIEWEIVDFWFHICWPNEALKDNLLVPRPCRKLNFRAQFHQRSTCSFYVRKLRVQLFWAYILGLYFTGYRLLAQKLRVECWWNSAQATKVCAWERENVCVSVNVCVCVSRNNLWLLTEDTNLP